MKILFFILILIFIFILILKIKQMIKNYKEKQEIIHLCEVEDFLDDFGRTTGITYKSKKEIQKDRDAFDLAMKLQHGFTVYK